MKAWMCVSFIWIVFSSLVAASDLETELKSMVQSERDFARTSVEKGMRHAFIAYLAEDSVVFNPDYPVPGKQWAEKIPQPGNGVLNWHPVYADIAASGDLGYTTGPWDFKSNAQPQEISYGEFNSIWRKQPDGSWKNVCDFGIDHPAPQHSSGEFRPSLKEENTRPQSADLATSREALMNAERQFSRLSAEKGTAQAYLSTLSSDARLYRKGQFPFVGTKSIEDYFAKNPAVQQQWDPIFSDVSMSADLGYAYGSIKTEGKAEKSYYMRVWEKQFDGTWKVVLDVNNTAPE
jgi:ketosteroid isomerase-like protein